MAYNEQLANRIREALGDQSEVEEKKMFKGICFMVNGKMCLCASGDEMLTRLGPDHFEEALETNGCRGMIRNGKPLKDFVFVGPEAMRTQQQFDHWVNIALAFNPFAKATKTKSK